MSKLASLPLADELSPDQIPRPPKAPPRSPIIRIPTLDIVPEQQPPAPEDEPEIIPFPPGMPRELPPPRPPEERAEE